jgi:predicted secreted hydrolase
MVSWHKKLLWALLCLTASVSIAAADDSSGFLSVTGPCRLEFPRDHAPHPGFRTEWWYWTGNLKSDTGRHFGFQLTFFRYQLTHFGGAAEWPEPRSAWRSRQIYLGHAALSDLQPSAFPGREVGREARSRGWVQWGPDITFSPGLECVICRIPSC